jgi:prephenate dehydrogenase
MTTTLRQVTIVGLGLIGGSIAQSLRLRFPELVLVAVDRGHVGARADVGQVVNRFVELSSVDNQRSLIAKSDLVVLCQPVHVIANQIAMYVSPECVVTDTGSTKRHIVEAARGLTGADWFVPGHPMAGKEQGGFENRSPDLFVGRPWILCPEGRHPDATARVEAFVDGLGARRISMTPEQHDAAVAAVSHAPQIISSLLLVAGAERNALPTAGPAFADMTRIAGGDEAIWRDILETNANEVGRVLQDATRILSTLANGLLAHPPRVDDALELVRRARRLKTSS